MASWVLTRKRVRTSGSFGGKVDEYIGNCLIFFVGGGGRKRDLGKFTLGYLQEETYRFEDLSCYSCSVDCLSHLGRTKLGKVIVML